MLSSKEKLDALASLLTPSEASKHRDKCVRIVEAVLKAGNFPLKVGIGPISYDVLHKATEEINRLSDETIEKIFSEVKQLILE